MGSMPSRFSQFARIALKELREILRDRRTIITLVLMPIFLYPLLGGIVQKVLLSSVAKMGNGPVYLVGFETEADARRFQALSGMKFSAVPDPAGTDQADQSGTPPEDDAKTPEDTIRDLMALDAEPGFNGVMPHNGQTISLESLIETRSADVGVRLSKQQGNVRNSRTLELEFVYATGSKYARDAKNALQKELAKANVTALMAAAGRPGEDPPLTFVETRIQQKGQSAFSLVTFIPLALILMTVTGAVYPAIDLTAGERERGTMETLIAAPVSRLGLLLAKFVAVLTVAMLTAIINLVAMLITLYAIGMDKAVFGDGGISPGMIITIIALLTVFAAFFSAVLLSITSFARSFKEAQAYLIPLMLISLTPGIFSLMPDIQLNGLLAVLPLVNVVLAARDVLQGTIDPTMLAVSMASTAAYGLMALSIATKVFGTDSILYGSSGTWSETFRRPSQSVSFPTMSAAILCLVVLVPTFMVMSSATGRVKNPTMNLRLVLTMFVQSLFVLIPLFVCWWNKFQIRSSFSLRRPQVRAVLGALLLGASLWPFAYELTAIATQADRLEELHKLFAPLKDKILAIPLGLRILALAIVPAFCEEWFFRGILLSAMRSAVPQRTKRSDAVAIVVTAVLFAAFHVLVQDKLFFERFLPSCLMGLVLGWVCVRTNSLLPGILLHCVHNGLLLASDKFEPHLAKLGLDLEGQQHLPPIWLGGAALLVAAGLFVIGVRGGAKSTAADTDPTLVTET